ncbi:MAG: glycoside hydrolase family 5 protein [Lachnospiraceae bacterium]|nr:glycoside hydrolase family 5 protein [Lachnospiraceae bacterium]
MSEYAPGSGGFLFCTDRRHEVPPTGGGVLMTEAKLCEATEQSVTSYKVKEASIMRRRIQIKHAGRAAALLLMLTITGCGASGQVQQNSNTPDTTEEQPAAAAQEDAGAVTQEAVADDAEAAEPAQEPSGEQQEETQEPAQTGEEEAMDNKIYDATGSLIPNNEALSFAKSFGPGFNLGNTFDAYRDSGLKADLSDELTTETYWQPVETTRETIQGLADAGIRTIRIPVSWHNHITDDQVTISPVYMDRVNTVVDWALDAGMKVILNIHHDNHPEANGFYPDSAHAEQSRKYISGIWKQLAERYRDYDDRLIFESMNEPRLVGHENEWWFTIDEPEEAVADSMACINELNQLFVDTVRSVGGSHRNCYVMCPGYCASPDGALAYNFMLPKDAPDVENRIIVSIHAYIPYSFALEENGTDSFSAFRDADTGVIVSTLNKLYMKYVRNGIPVVIGEFGARDRNGNVEARAEYAGYYAAQAWSRGMPCCWWDNGSFSGSGEVFGIYDRKKACWKIPEIGETFVANAIPR